MAACGGHGVADGCVELGIPRYRRQRLPLQLVGRRVHQPLTPVVAMLGVLDDVKHRARPSGWTERRVWQSWHWRSLADELDGSAWARTIHDHLGGLPPKVDLAQEVALGNVLVALAEADVTKAAHDVSNGGLVQTLTDMVLRYRMGASIDLQKLGADDFTALFSESQARAVIAVPEHLLPAKR